MVLISEAGLYDLILRCDKPASVPFRQWVTGDVLPAIRKDGAYIVGEEKVASGEMDEDEFVLRALEIMKGKVDRLKAERDAALAGKAKAASPAGGFRASAWRTANERSHEVRLHGRRGRA